MFMVSPYLTKGLIISMDVGMVVDFYFFFV